MYALAMASMGCGVFMEREILAPKWICAISSHYNCRTAGDAPSAHVAFSFTSRAVSETSLDSWCKKPCRSVAQAAVRV